jgi:colanic acid/amylovoran biosynthesis glycosyltransferase
MDGSRQTGLASSRQAGHQLRIAYLVGSFPALSETFIISEVAGAIERGHDVTVLALAADRAPAVDHPDVARLGMGERTIHLGLPRRPDLWARSLLGHLWRQRGDAATLLGRLDRRAFLQGTDRGKFLHQALRLLRLPPFDVVHAQFGPLGLMGHRFRACGILHGRLVTTFRGFDISRYVRDNGPDVYRRLFDEGDHFLTNCDFFRRRLVELGCAPERLSVQRSSVDVRRFVFRPRGLPAEGSIVVGTVGRLVEKKGIADCLQALAGLIDEHPRLRYRILGDGPLRGDLEAMARRLGLDGHVSFLGAGDQEAVRRLLEDCHLFLAPSVTAADGDQDAPVNTLKEAMAMGVPVVSTWHGGIPELVTDGVSGRLVPERDPAALAAALRELLAAPARLDSFARAGRAEVEASWDRERLNDRLDALYRRLASAPSARVQAVCGA